MPDFYSARMAAHQIVNVQVDDEVKRRAAARILRFLPDENDRAEIFAMLGLTEPRNA